MKVEVRPINKKGKPLPKADRNKEKAHVGLLRILENRLHKLGRAVTCAKLVSATDDTEQLLLPELYDTTILWASGDAIRLRGFEDIEDTQYAQTWEVKVTGCSD